MRRALLGIGAALLLLGGAAETAVGLDRWWLGEAFEGLPLTHEEGGLFIYGDCEPPPDGGCAPPLEVQNRRTCARNPVAIDIPAGRLYPVRGGGIAAEYGDGIDLLTDGSTVTVYSTNARELRAVPQVRRRRADQPPDRLERPHFPWPVMAELKRVVDARRTHGSSIRAISRATGVSRGRVRVRLGMADLLGRVALADIRAPRISWRRVQRYRQIAFLAQELGRRAAMKQYDVTRPELRRIIRRVRGLTITC